MILKPLLMLILTSQPIFSLTWTEEAQPLIKKEIRDIGSSPQHFGIWIKKGDQVAELNSQKLFIPASLSKIPTALTFLHETAMDQKFKTWVYTTGKIDNGILKGDLYLKGGGDPTFVTESMAEILNQLKRSDIKKVQGQVYVDESYFDTDYYSKGRQQRRVDRAYDAPVGALSYNWNSIAIYIRPGMRPGQPGRVYTDPELPNIEIINKSRTTSESQTQLRVERKIKNDKVIISVRGKISTTKDEKAFYKSIEEPALWTGLVFKKGLKQSGIEYEGDIKKAKTPQGAKSLVEFESWSVPRVMSALSKFSNNFVAEMLTKHLGKQEGAPATIDRGLEKIESFLLKRGWSKSDFVFENPSGFTKNNKMRADRLGELLEGARDDFSLAPEFMASLPISGTDGTLKSRMKQTMRGKVRAKTGYLAGVVGLAGYMETRSGGEPITFVFFYNGSYKKDWEVRAMFGRLLWRLYQKS